MNSYTAALTKASEEIRAFAGTDEGRRVNADWYGQILSLVKKAESQKNDEAAERYLDMLLHAIVDTGPLGKGFAPSIGQAADAMQRKRKQAFKQQRVHSRHGA